MSRVKDQIFVNELDSLVKENPTWNIVDVGGGMYPYKRANYIVDFKEFGTVPDRTFGNWSDVYWNKDTWIKADICDTQTPLPFEDKFLLAFTSLHENSANTTGQSADLSFRISNSELDST